MIPHHPTSRLLHEAREASVPPVENGASRPPREDGVK